MELSRDGSHGFDLVQPHTGPTDSNVTLLSYNSGNGKNHTSQFLKNQHRKFVQNQSANNYVVSSSAQNSQCKKLNFRPFRKRSKSASRLEDRRRSLSRSNLDLDLIFDDQITYKANGERQENSPEKSAVTLVGFSNHNSEFAPYPSPNQAKESPNSRFATLRTSREVKMERERMRQEKLHRLTQETKDWFDRMKSEHVSPTRLEERQQQFFNETRERILQSSRLESSDAIGQFVREHQERFAALTASIRGDSMQTSTEAASTEIGKPQSMLRSLSSSSEITAVKLEASETSAADLVASILHGSELSKKHLRKSSSSSKIGSLAESKIRTIEIKREDFLPSPADHQLQKLHRSNSGGSDSSSGFGSLNNNSKNTAENSSSDIIIKKLEPVNPTVTTTKLQLLQERRNKALDLSKSEHHPSFANHFGFAARYANFNRNNLLHKRIMNGSGLNSAKMALTKSKSSMEYSKDNHSYRYSSEELTLATFGDSETESDDDDVDFENLDSVSIVAARASSSSSSTSSNGSSSNARTIIRPRGASPSLDSGRGDSPESSCNSTLVLTPPTTTSTSSPKKPPRPISAVPSEYSDVSTSSCRTSDEGDLEDSLKHAKIVSSTTPTQKEEEGDEEEEGPTQPELEAKLQQPQQQPPEALSKEVKMARVHRVASELLSTEEQYVTVLYLIDQIFHFRVDQENRLSNLFPPEVLPQMFANIKSIYKFHAEFLLPQLRERMGLWHTDESYQRIGDIVVKFSPFFKMYTEYVKNFDHAIHTINQMYAKNSKFAAIMDEIHALPECGNLSLQHHMLTPIQRIPRYEMLLKDYLKKLPEDSLDRTDSEKALHLVSTAATHANDAMKRIEKFKKLLEVQESLGGTVDLVSPTRELLREGKIVKISARSGDHQDRYLFLFSDLLLLCSARLITNRVISGGGATFRLRAKFEVDNMQILEGDNLITANTFYIRDDHKSVELYTSTRREKEEWLGALFEAIKELYQRKSSLRIGREILRPCDSEIGKRPPHLLKLDAIHKCMECSQMFTMMRKKYNCRACGIVCCAKCSGQKQPLAFEDNKALRVCKSCHEVMSLRVNEINQSDSSSSSANQPQFSPVISKDSIDGPSRPKGLLEIPANCENLESGFLMLKNGGGGCKPVKRWFVLAPDFVLYSFKSNDELEALTATPIPGHAVVGGADLRGDPLVAEKDRDRVVKIFYASSSLNNNSHPVPISARKTYYLVAESSKDMSRWIKALKSASVAEIPPTNNEEE